MKTVNQVIGSVEQVYIQKQFLRCSSLLPATVAATTAAPTIEATAAAIGHQDRTATTPASSASAASMSVWAASAVRAGTLSAAYRNNKSLRSVDLEFPNDFSVEEPLGSPPDKSRVGVSRPDFSLIP